MLDKDVEDFELDLGVDVEDTPEVETPVVEATPNDNPDDSPELELSEVEQVAFAQGWRPKEQFVAEGGDAAKWRPADWWLDRGELLGRTQELNRELKTVKDAFVRMSAANRDSYIKGRQDALRQMKQDRRSALKEQNLEVVAEIEEKIESVESELNAVHQQEQLQQQQQRAAQPSPEYVNWLERNQWYLTDETLHNYANAVAKKFVDYNPNANQSDALEFISENIRREFPHKFSGMQRVAQPNVGGRVRQDSTKQSNKGDNIDTQFNKIVSSMDPDTKRIVADMIRSKELTKEEYVQSYNKLRG